MEEIPHRARRRVGSRWTLICAAGVLLFMVGLLGLGLGLFAPWGDSPSHDGSTGTRIEDRVAAIWLLTLGGSGSLALGVGALLFSFVELIPDRSSRLRLWKLCLWAGVALLPGPVIGWAGSVLMSRHQLESIRLPMPGEPEPEPYNRFAQPLVASVLGVAVGAIGAVVVCLSLWQILTLRHAQAEERAGKGAWT